MLYCVYLWFRSMLNYGRFGRGSMDMDNDANGYERFYSWCSMKNSYAIQVNFLHYYFVYCIWDSWRCNISASRILTSFRNVWNDTICSSDGRDWGVRCPTVVGAGVLLWTAGVFTGTLRTIVLVLCATCVKDMTIRNKRRHRAEVRDGGFRIRDFHFAARHVVSRGSDQTFISYKENNIATIWAPPYGVVATTPCMKLCGEWVD